MRAIGLGRVCGSAAVLFEQPVRIMDESIVRKAFFIAIRADCTGAHL